MKELPEITIGAVGDISFEGRVSDKPDFSVFSEVRHIMKSCDLGIANLENPLTSRGQKVPGKCTLHGDPGWASVLKESGINVVSLANNHMMDYGCQGLFDTVDALDSAGIRHLGAGKNRDAACAPLFLSIKGRNMAFLARSSVIVSSPSYAGPSTPGVAFLDTEELIDKIRSCRDQADRVIVILHWGLEEYFYPAPAQVNLARRIVAAGADEIIGHHPHVLQGVQRKGNALVAYSLGNFLFDDFSWDAGGEKDKNMIFTLSESNRKGMILKMSWDEANRLEFSKVYTRIAGDGRIVVDHFGDRESEFKTLSKGLDMPLYACRWRLHAIGREWNLRVKHAIKPARIMKNIWKIRPRHIKEFVRSLKKSADIAGEKSTNPYD